jgi:hypothetical protein
MKIKTTMKIIRKITVIQIATILGGMISYFLLNGDLVDIISSYFCINLGFLLGLWNNT